MDFSKKQSLLLKFCGPRTFAFFSVFSLMFGLVSLGYAGGYAGEYAGEYAREYPRGYEAESGPLEHLFWSPDARDQNKIIQNGKLNEENERQLFQVTSDVSKGVLDVKVLLNAQSELLGLRYITESGSILSFNLNQLASGGDLFKSGKRSVVKIIGRSLSPSTGGRLELIYLENGITNSYSKFNMMLVNSGNGSEKNWEIETLPSENGRGEPGRKFTKMGLKGNWFFGTVIGIQEITVD
jgi:hypothetical protein